MFFAYPGRMSGDGVWVAVRDAGSSALSAVSGATPLSITTLSPGFTKFEAQLEQAGFGLWNLFVGHYPGCVADTSALACLIGAVILMITGVASARIILGGVMGLLLTSFGFMVLSQSPLNPWMSVNPLYHLCAGGFAFGIAYMATDPVTAPGTTATKWVCGCLIGALTVVIRVLNPAFPEGVMLAILFMNLFSPLLDVIEIRMRLGKRIPNV